MVTLEAVHGLHSFRTNKTSYLSAIKHIHILHFNTFSRVKIIIANNLSFVIKHYLINKTRVHGMTHSASARLGKVMASMLGRGKPCT